MVSYQHILFNLGFYLGDILFQAAGVVSAFTWSGIILLNTEC